MNNFLSELWQHSYALLFSSSTLALLETWWDSNMIYILVHTASLCYPFYFFWRHHILLHFLLYPSLHLLYLLPMNLIFISSFDFLLFLTWCKLLKSCLILDLLMTFNHGNFDYFTLAFIWITEAHWSLLCKTVLSVLAGNIWFHYSFAMCL